MKVLLCPCSGREAGETREGRMGAGGCCPGKQEAQPAQAHGAVGWRLRKAKWQSPGHATARCIFGFVYSIAPQGEMLRSSVRRGSWPGLGPSHFTHSCFTPLWCLRRPQQSLTLSRHPRKRGRWEKGSYLKPAGELLSPPGISQTWPWALGDPAQGPGQVPSSSSSQEFVTRWLCGHCLTILLCFLFPCFALPSILSLESFPSQISGFFSCSPFFPSCFHYMEWK